MQSRWNSHCRGIEEQMNMVCLDSPKPFTVAGALKAKRRVGEEAEVIITGQTKRLRGTLKGGWVIIYKICWKCGLRTTESKSSDNVLEMQELRPQPRPPKPPILYWDPWLTLKLGELQVEGKELWSMSCQREACSDLYLLDWRRDKIKNTETTEKSAVVV